MMRVGVELCPICEQFATADESEVHNAFDVNTLKRWYLRTEAEDDR